MNLIDGHNIDMLIYAFDNNQNRWRVRGPQPPGKNLSTGNFCTATTETLTGNFHDTHALKNRNAFSNRYALEKKQCLIKKGIKK